MINIIASTNVIYTWLGKSRVVVGLLVICMSGLLQNTFAQEPDWSQYGQLLNQYVAEGKLDNIDLATVNYQALKQDPLFKQVTQQISTFSVNQLANEKEKLAFYINAYNIYAIKMVVDHWPVASIKDIGNFFFPVWKKEVGTLAGKAVTLDEIEHEIIRPMGEPRIHMAIVCASISCPDLRTEPYTASQLDVQLDEQTSRFLNNTTKGLQVRGQRLSVSKIFDWFGEDFDRLGGVATFIRQYRTEIPENPNIDFDLEYNWKLNKPS